MATEYNITDLYRGDTYTFHLDVYAPGEPDEDGNPTQGDPIDLEETGWAFKVQVRVKRGRDAELVAEGLIEIDPNHSDGNRLWIAFSSDDTEKMVRSSYYWDLQVTMPPPVVPAGLDRFVQTWLYGKISPIGEVTE